jgi:hypothetical protein
MLRAIARVAFLWLMVGIWFSFQPLMTLILQICTDFFLFYMENQRKSAKSAASAVHTLINPFFPRFWISFLM